MIDPTDAMFAAAGFAAKAHQFQKRKDGLTPYVAHVFRVCLTVRHVFGIADPKVLTAALLHDTIEDTPTDFDDVAEQFGADVAGWVAALTKDMRLPDDSREDAYRAVLAAAPWQVIACKLADLYDNLSDSRHLSPNSRARTVARSEAYLAALKSQPHAALHDAFAAVEKKLAEVRAST